MIAALTPSPSKVADFLCSTVPWLLSHSAKGNTPVPAPLTDEWVKKHPEYSHLRQQRAAFPACGQEPSRSRGTLSGKCATQVKDPDLQGLSVLLPERALEKDIDQHLLVVANPAAMDGAIKAPVLLDNCGLKKMHCT